MIEEKIEEKKEEVLTPIVEKIKEQETFMNGSISKISSIGIMTVVFDEVLKNITYEDLNSSMVNIYIEEAAERKVENINLTWTLDKVEGNKMIFQLNFEKP